MITETLMKPGRFDLKLVETGAYAKWSAVREFDHIVITPTRVDPATLSDAQILGAAVYTGVVTGKPTPTSFTGQGLAFWLGTDQGVGDLLDTAVTQTAANFSTWINSLLPSSITAGTITSPAGTLTCAYQYVTRREAIDNVCKLFGAEWSISPAGALSAAVPATLFANYTTPKAVVTRKGEGTAGGFVGLEARQINRARDVQGYTSKIVVIGKRGDGASVATGTATATPVYKDLLNNDVVMERLVDGPNLPAAFANTYAAAALSLYPAIRQSVTLSSDTYAVAARTRPGDTIYVYDPVADLVDTANQVVWRGETIFPVRLRCKSYTWPIQRGMGVYARRSGATPVYTDLTDQVQWEDGETTWEVGTSMYDSDQDPQQLSPAYLGVNPAILSRLVMPEWVSSAAPTFGNVTGGVAAGWYKQTAVDEIEFIIEITAGTATAAGIVNVSIPGGYTAVGIQPVGALLSVGGIVSTTASCRTNAGGTTLNLYATAAGANFGAGASVVSRITGHAIRI